MQASPVSRWFRPKTLGWGYTPATWEGWLCTAGATAVILAIAALVR